MVTPSDSQILEADRRLGLKPSLRRAAVARGTAPTARSPQPLPACELCRVSLSPPPGAVLLFPAVGEPAPIRPAPDAVHAPGQSPAGAVSLRDLRPGPGAFAVAGGEVALRAGAGPTTADPDADPHDREDGVMDADVGVSSWSLPRIASRSTVPGEVTLRRSHGVILERPPGCAEAEPMEIAILEVSSSSERRGMEDLTGFEFLIVGQDLAPRDSRTGELSIPPSATPDVEGAVSGLSPIVPEAPTSTPDPSPGSSEPVPEWVREAQEEAARQAEEEAVRLAKEHESADASRGPATVEGRASGAIDSPTGVVDPGATFQAGAGSVGSGPVIETPGGMPEFGRDGSFADPNDRAALAALDFELVDRTIMAHMVAYAIPNGSLTLTNKRGHLVYAKSFTNLSWYRRWWTAFPLDNLPDGEVLGAYIRRDRGLPNLIPGTSPCTLFRWASVTKLITAVMFLRLVERSQAGTISPTISLDSPVFPLRSGDGPNAAPWASLYPTGNQFWNLWTGDPSYDLFARATGYDVGELRIHHLLTHTTGWQEGREGEDCDAGAKIQDLVPTVAAQPAVGGHLPISFRQLVDYQSLPGAADSVANQYQAQIAYRPGTHYCYANYSFALVGQYAALAAGRSLSEVYASNVFRTAHMYTASMVLDSRLSSRVAGEAFLFGRFAGPNARGESPDNPLYSDGWATDSPSLVQSGVPQPRALKAYGGGHDWALQGGASSLRASNLDLSRLLVRLRDDTADSRVLDATSREQLWTWRERHVDPVHSFDDVLHSGLGWDVEYHDTTESLTVGGGGMDRTISQPELATKGGFSNGVHSTIGVFHSSATGSSQRGLSSDDRAGITWACTFNPNNRAMGEVLGVEAYVDGAKIGPVIEHLLGQAQVHNAIQRASGDLFRMYGA